MDGCIIYDTYVQYVNGAKSTNFWKPTENVLILNQQINLSLFSAQIVNKRVIILKNETELNEEFDKNILFSQKDQ